MGRKKTGRSSRPVNRNVRRFEPNRRLPLKLLKLTALRPISSPVRTASVSEPIRSKPRNTTRGQRRGQRGREDVSAYKLPSPDMFPVLGVPQGRETVKKIKSPCVARSERREVLFAKRRAGKGSGNSRRRDFTASSLERC